MRGKAGEKLSAEIDHRITPAYAGKSQFVGGFVLALGDHPRVCGEKNNRSLRVVLHTGSPPRMRGKAVLIASAIAFIRITPAYAGKSLQFKESQLRNGDHPRVCGEKTKKIP